MACGKKKNNKSLKEMLNDAIAREIQVSIQYMWQHVQSVGLKGKLLKEPLKRLLLQK